jgi:hypothetical protein
MATDDPRTLWRCKSRAQLEERLAAQGCSVAMLRAAVASCGCCISAPSWTAVPAAASLDWWSAHNLWFWNRDICDATTTK